VSSVVRKSRSIHHEDHEDRVGPEWATTRREPAREVQGLARPSALNQFKFQITKAVGDGARRFLRVAGFTKECQLQLFRNFRAFFLSRNVLVEIDAFPYLI